MVALAGTVSVTLGLTVYAMTTKKDMTFIGGTVYMIVAFMTFVSFTSLFVRHI